MSTPSSDRIRQSGHHSFKAWYAYIVIKRHESPCAVVRASQWILYSLPSGNCRVSAHKSHCFLGSLPVRHSQDVPIYLYWSKSALDSSANAIEIVWGLAFAVSHDFPAAASTKEILRLLVSNWVCMTLIHGTFCTWE